MSVGLILDEKPEWCEDCIAYREHYDLCGMVGKRNPHEWLPDWCPLQEVEPVKHGHWIKGGRRDTPYDWQCVECSECGHREPSRMALNRYCGNCGAKMEPEVRNEQPETVG